MTPTKEQVNAGLKMIVAVTEAIREARELPSGTLYATLCGKVDMEGYDKMIRLILNTGLVEKRGDLLRWVGPEITKGATC